MITEQDVVYISGPMTGIEDFNYPLFNSTESVLLHTIGCGVLNPTIHPDGLTWTEYMRLDVELLQRATVLLQLPGWGASRGARIEYDLALMAGLVVLDLGYLARYNV